MFFSMMSLTIGQRRRRINVESLTSYGPCFCPEGLKKTCLKALPSMGAWSWPVCLLLIIKEAHWSWARSKKNLPVSLSRNSIHRWGSILKSLFKKKKKKKKGPAGKLVSAAIGLQMACKLLDMNRMTSTLTQFQEKKESSITSLL